MAIQTGQIFVIKADDPRLLSSFELLELQGDLRIAAISGAAEPSNDDYSDHDNNSKDLSLWKQDEDLGRWEL